MIINSELDHDEIKTDLVKKKWLWMQWRSCHSLQAPSIAKWNHMAIAWVLKAWEKAEGRREGKSTHEQQHLISIVKHAAKIIAPYTFSMECFVYSKQSLLHGKKSRQTLIGREAFKREKKGEVEHNGTLLTHQKCTQFQGYEPWNNEKLKFDALLSFKHLSSQYPKIWHGKFTRMACILGDGCRTLCAAPVDSNWIWLSFKSNLSPWFAKGVKNIPLRLVSNPVDWYCFIIIIIKNVAEHGRIRNEDDIWWWLIEYDL